MAGRQTPHAVTRSSFDFVQRLLASHLRVVVLSKTNKTTKRGMDCNPVDRVVGQAGHDGVVVHDRRRVVHAVGERNADEPTHHGR